MTSEYEKSLKRLDRENKRRERERKKRSEEGAVRLAQDTILLIAQLLLPFTKGGRASIVRKAVEIAEGLDPKERSKKAKEESSDKT